jgi:hypothetical protein
VLVTMNSSIVCDVTAQSEFSHILRPQAPVLLQSVPGQNTNSLTTILLGGVMFHNFVRAYQKHIQSVWTADICFPIY